MLSNCDINDEIMGKVYNKCVISIEHLELSIGGICLNECDIPEVELEENNTDYLREEIMKITTLSLPTTKICLQTSK